MKELDNLPTSESTNFLNGGGEMGRLIRSFNWANTPLGDPVHWPQSLKITLGILLNSKFPMFLFWGKDFTCFYNDAYRPSLGTDGKHPSILGMPAAQAWTDAWDNVGQTIDYVLANNEATWSEDQLVPFYRNGRIEDIYWTYSYSPIPGDGGLPSGILVTCTETTEKVLNQRALEARNQELQVLMEVEKQAQKRVLENERNLSYVIQQAPVAIAIFRTEKYIVETVNAKALALWGRSLSAVVHKPILDAMPELREQGIKALLDDVYKTGRPFSASELPLQLNRNGRMETAYINFVYEPLYDAADNINGLITIGFEVTDQVLARKQIEESEERFRSMAEGSGVLMAVTDETGDVIYCNSAWCTLTGKPIDEILKFGWVELIPPDERDHFTNLYLEAFKKRESIEMELRIMSVTGRYRWLLARGTPRFRADGSFAGYISACTDITEQKQQQRELAASERKLEQILSQLPAMVVVLQGREHIVVSANESVRKFWQRTREEVLGRSILDIFPELKNQPFPLQWKHVFDTGETITQLERPLTLNRENGPMQYYVDYYYQPLRDADGIITAVIATVIDVTDKVKYRLAVEKGSEELQAINEEVTSANEEMAATNEELAEIQANLQDYINRLSESEGKLKQAITTGRMGTWSIDPKTQQVTMSGFIKELFGFDPKKEVEMEWILEAVHPDYRKMLTDILQNAIENYQSSDTEYPITNVATGEQKWVRATGQVFFDSFDKPVEYSGMLMDITERKLDELRKNDFIGMVSHELKTPLTSLSAYMQMLYGKALKSEDRLSVNALEKANIQVKKMTNMINGFLNISRLESGKIQLNKQYFTLTDLVSEMLTDARLTITGHEIVFICNNEIAVYADREKIEAVISNLLSNAVKYSPKGRTIEINCDVEDGNAVFSIKDEGMGVKPQDIDKLFERYYRVETKNTAHISGFGIGLYLSSEIVRRHNGKIWVESESGKGSTFYFTLPLTGDE